MGSERVQKLPQTLPLSPVCAAFLASIQRGANIEAKDDSECGPLGNRKEGGGAEKRKEEEKPEENCVKLRKEEENGRKIPLVMSFLLCKGAGSKTNQSGHLFGDGVWPPHGATLGTWASAGYATGFDPNVLSLGFLL